MKHMNKQEKIDRLLLALETPSLDAMNTLRLSYTLTEAGVPGTQTNRNILRRLAVERNIRVTELTSRGKTLTACGMALGPESQSLTWDIIQKPAVYTIICKSTQRRYIGSSQRPDLRRAVHYFFLRNPTSKLSSNIFRSGDIHKDALTYGADDFYMEILQSLPVGSTRSEIYNAEQAIISSQDEPFHLYNCQLSGKKSRVVKVLNPEWRELKKEWTATHKVNTRIRNRLIRAAMKSIPRMITYSRSS